MPVMQSGEIYYPLLLRSERHKIGIAAYRDLAFIRNPNRCCRIGGHPPNHLRQAVASVSRFCPDHGQPELQRRTPPQAAAKSPLSGRFSSGGLGEWSETTKSITPSASACQSRSRFAASRTGGQL